MSTGAGFLIGQFFILFSRHIEPNVTFVLTTSLPLEEEKPPPPEVEPKHAKRLSNCVP